VELPRRQFISETEDLIEQVFAALDELRGHPAPQRQRELIADIFRQIHRIKGSAATLSFAGLAEIAHEFEHLLSALRDGHLAVSAGVLDHCENATTALSESLTLAAAGIVEPSRRDLFESLRALAPAAEPDPVLEASLSTVLPQLPAELAQALTDEEKRRIGRRHAEGKSLCVITTGFDIAGFEEQFFGLKERLAELGEVISTSPAVDPEHGQRVNFQILVASNESIQILGNKLLSFPNLTITQLASTNTNEQSISPSAVTPLPALDFIRTDLGDLDQLLSATNDLSRLTSALLDGAASQNSQVQSQASEIRNSFLQLQRDLINLRMVSLGPTLHRAVRAGRAAARALGKEVDFEVIGAALRLDKLLCDAIADPLVHLVRNSVDHGIETSEARVAMGKPQRGKVIIEAIRMGSRTRVRVTDDGCGIDPVTISRAAARLGIIERSQDLDLNHSLRLIFRPGFSVLSVASHVSGRGVGLDIVETAVERVGGEVRVSSVPGQKAIFEIRLPVTFSLLDSTIAGVGENRYCLARSEVIRTDQMPSSQLAGNSLRTERGALPLVHLSEVLVEAHAPLRDGQRSLITCELPLNIARETGELFETRSGKQLIGLVADEVIGSKEVLVRNLGRHGGRWYGVAGAAELQDGTVALVLDLPRLLSKMKLAAY
jgi:two-component system chemotaxis sensor kinase CheA